MLTWLLAAESVYSLPQSQPIGSVAEKILEQTATESSTAFKTQYPPSNAEERLLIPETSPIYRVALDKQGHPAEQPFPTGVDRVLDDIAHLLSPDDSTADSSVPAPTIGTGPATTSFGEVPSGPPTALPGPPGGTGYPSSMDNQDVFQPVATNAPPANIKARDDHPVKNLHANSSDPIETNKFYAGLFLGTQTNASFTQPYSLSWSGGKGSLKSWGFGVTHLEENVLAYGPKNDKLPGKPAEYYINPVGLQHMILSASELDKSSVLNVENPKAFSAHAILSPSAGSNQSITFPVVQGMGYVTGVYNDLQPLIESGVFFRKVVSAGSPKPGIYKYQVALEDDTHWVLYASPNDGKDPELKLATKSTLRGPHGFSGSIQVAKNPAGKSGEKFYDNSAGVYPVAGHISGSVTGDTGSYSLSWTKGGKHTDGTPLIMFALPHHVESFDRNTTERVTSVHLRSTTKGNATAIIGDSWTMVEPELPVDMGFAPWSTSKGNIHALSPSSKEAIVQIAPYELQQNISEQTSLNSMYYSGKALSKFATLVWTVSQLGGDDKVSSKAFQELKDSFALFVNNHQQYPLAYDSVWKGVVSSAGYDGDLNQDFGNTAYNDHHFHYGYFIQAAAIIGSLDPDWLAQNKDWVNMLVRDAGNSVENDPHFPFSRAFDWFNGHSWAKGLFESYDGKDEESTSEDTMFAYAVKMWGQTIGDASMEARGNLMLGVMRRSLDNYFLMRNNNTNQPAQFIGNKVTGILFENKVDHTTYFGNNLEYIQGIHMLPLLPHSAYTRSQEFVSEEWEAMFSPNASTPADKVDGGWKGVLFANLALVNPKASWNFFAQHHFDYSWIDGGASRTWYLAYAAALGGL